MTILIAVLFSLKGWTQLEIGMQNQQPIIPSWENYELMKYGKIGASMYTGTVNYSIPIYTYKDNDFEIPISINYATNGYRVNHSSGILGHGWSLSMPGIITREVRGIPDEKTITRSTLYGNYLLHKGYMSLPADFERTVMSAYMTPSFHYQLFQCQVQSDIYEPNCDIFNFEFCGYRGSFSCTPNNQLIDGSRFHVFNAEGISAGLKIELIQNDFVIREINIRDTSGYVYHFTASEFYQMDQSDGMPNNEYVVTAWVLDLITAPNGRKITFTYDKKTPGYIQSQNKEHIYTPAMSYYHAIWMTHSPAPAEYVAKIFDQWKSRYRLTKIDFNDGITATFTYMPGASERKYSMGNNGSFSTEIARCDSNRLVNIAVCYKNDTLKSCDFEYCTNISEPGISSSNRVTFLHSVDISGEGRYTFGYNNENGHFPCLGTTESDHWGYYNGPDGWYLPSRYQIAGHLSYDENHNESIVGTFRVPDFEAARMGTLSRITYPTGGHSLLQYEPHSYAKRMVRTSQSDFHPTLECLEDERIAGGVRIKRIINCFSSDTYSDTITYHYSDSGHSSGILLTYPRYGIEYTANDTYGNIKDVKYHSLNNFIYDNTRTHIEYSSVRVERSGAGCTEYRFSCANDFLDHRYREAMNEVPLFTPVQQIDMSSYQTHYEAGQQVREILTPTPSCQFLRGRLVEQTEYDADGTKVLKTINRYDSVLVCMDTCMHIAGEVAIDVVSPRYNLFPSSIATTMYKDGDSICQHNNFEHNALGLLSLEKRSTSKGGILLTKYRYVCDTVSNDAVISGMKAHHLTGKILKTENCRIDGADETLLSSARLTYYMPDTNKASLFCPSQKEEWNGTEWVVTERYQYNHIGNLVELMRENGLTNAYLWGYNGRYNIGLAANATFNQMREALNSIVSEQGGAAHAIPTINEPNYERLKQLGLQLPSSLVTLWKYKPLVGMTQNIPASLMYNQYGYNKFGQLIDKSDTQEHLLEQYDYNVVTKRGTVNAPNE